MRALEATAHAKGGRLKCILFDSSVAEVEAQEHAAPAEAPVCSSRGRSWARALACCASSRVQHSDGEDDGEEALGRDAATGLLSVAAARSLAGITYMSPFSFRDGLAEASLTHSGNGSAAAAPDAQ